MEREKNNGKVESEFGLKPMVWMNKKRSRFLTWLYLEGMEDDFNQKHCFRIDLNPFEHHFFCDRSVFFLLAPCVLNNSFQSIFSVVKLLSRPTFVTEQIKAVASN